MLFLPNVTFCAMTIYNVLGEYTKCFIPSPRWDPHTAIMWATEEAKNLSPCTRSAFQIGIKIMLSEIHPTYSGLSQMPFTQMPLPRGTLCALPARWPLPPQNPLAPSAVHMSLSFETSPCPPSGLCTPWEQRQGPSDALQSEDRFDLETQVPVTFQEGCDALPVS